MVRYYLLQNVKVFAFPSALLVGERMLQIHEPALRGAVDVWPAGWLLHFDVRPDVAREARVSLPDLGTRSVSLPTLNPLHKGPLENAQLTVQS